MTLAVSRLTGLKRYGLMACTWLKLLLANGIRPALATTSTPTAASKLRFTALAKLQTFDVAQSEDIKEAHIVRLHRGAKLKGIVRDAAGDRVAGARVWLGRTETTSDHDGVFLLDRVRTGDVVLRAKKADETAALPLGLFAGDELVTLELSLERQ